MENNYLMKLLQQCVDDSCLLLENEFKGCDEQKIVNKTQNTCYNKCSK
jgi:hypothetical protein